MNLPNTSVCKIRAHAGYMTQVLLSLLGQQCFLYQYLVKLNGYIITHWQINWHEYSKC